MATLTLLLISIILRPLVPTKKPIVYTLYTLQKQFNHRVVGYPGSRQTGETVVVRALLWC